MSQYLYRKTDGVYTTGFYTPSGEWEPEHDCDTPEEAATRCAWLNGSGQAPAEKVPEGSAEV